MNCSGRTPKYRAIASLASLYSGYTANPSGDNRSRNAAITRAEHPTVFSLKSSRSLPTRLPVGGVYGAIAITALRGLIAPFGSFNPLPKPHLHRLWGRLQ